MLGKTTNGYSTIRSRGASSWGGTVETARSSERIDYEVRTTTRDGTRRNDRRGTALEARDGLSLSWRGIDHKICCTAVKRRKNE